MADTPSEGPYTFDEFRAFIARLEAQGLARLAPRWGITKATLMRGFSRPEQVVTGVETDSEAKLYRLADGSSFWDIALYSEDGSEGIPYFSDDFLLAPAAIVERGRAIEDWLSANPDAYELFTPILWSAAPDRARAALDWLLANETRLMASPLAAMYADLKAKLDAAVAS